MSTGRTLAIVGAVGALAGVGYAVNRSVRNGRAEIEKDADRALAELAKSGLDAPSVPLAEPTDADVNQRINRSTNTDGTVDQSVEELLAQARKYEPTITLDELTGARLAASEHGSGSFTELVCIIDSEANRAARRGQSFHGSVTRGNGFGKQGRERPASTRLDPKIRHFLAARIVFAGKARGIARSSIRFFDPYAMNRMNGKYRKWLASGRLGKKPAIVSCDALTLLEAWSFDYGKKGGNRCPPDRSKPGRNPLAWVGPIASVDPLRLMLMKPMALGAEHDRLYQAARAVLKRGFAKV